MDYRNRYYNQAEGNRGSLDDRIGLTEYQRTGGKQYVGRSRREEPLSYDDKPAARNFEERVNFDNRTLEDRISVATPNSTRKPSYGPAQNGDGSTNNRSVAEHSMKLGKRLAIKVCRKNIRSNSSPC